MKLRTILLATSLALLNLPVAYGINFDAQALNELGLSFRTQGATTLANGSTTDWFYGCAPTSAGMAMGFYDRNGYAGKTYDNLIPGGVAPEQSIAPNASILKSAIASVAHVNDYYSGNVYPGTYWDGNNGSYFASGDDVGTHAPTSLGDFMGTSQDNLLFGSGNVNGGTSFFYFPSGEKLHYTDLFNWGYESLDGMYGITEYVQYSGYSVVDAYTQVTSNVNSSGFTYNDFAAEIDAGRPVIVQISGHSMLGVGYDGQGNIDIYNTWDQGTHTMAWGDAYAGMDMWGVTVFELSGGSPQNTPDAGASLGLLLIGLLSLTALRRRAV